MVVQCENCQTKFEVDDSRIKEDGSKVRCSKCKHTFVIHKGGEENHPSPDLDETEQLESSSAAEDSAGQEGDDLDLDGFDFDETTMEDALSSSKDDLDLDDDLPDFDEDTDLDGLDSEQAPGDDSSIVEETPEEDLLSGLDDDLDLEDFSENEDKTAEELEQAIDEDLDFPSEGDDLLGEDEKDAFSADPSETVIEQDISDMFEEEDEEVSLEPEADDLAETEEFHADDYDFDDESTPAAEPKKSRSRAILWALILIFAVVAAGAAAWSIKPDLFPFKPLTKTTSPKVDDLGNKRIKLDPDLTKHSWIENDKEGQLLVITGLALNSYVEPRKFIMLRGMINENKDNILARTTVYAGNVISREELETLSMSKINKRLRNKAGDENVNTNIQPGKAIKFMVVFSKLPDNLAGYTVEVAGSLPKSE